jgi:hypothetical protein
VGVELCVCWCRETGFPFSAYSVCFDLFPLLGGHTDHTQLLTCLQMAVMLGLATTAHQQHSKLATDWGAPWRASVWAAAPIAQIQPRVFAHPMLSALVRAFLMRDGTPFLSYLLKYAPSYSRRVIIKCHIRPACFTRDSLCFSPFFLLIALSVESEILSWIWLPMSI